MEQLIECVPNISEGRNRQVLDAIARSIENVEQVKLLHRDSGEAANRTVFTFAGPPDAVLKAARGMANIVAERIDMRNHEGKHPRIGALDVCPFIPIQGISKAELIPMVEGFARTIHEQLKIPVFLYEDSARSEERRNLALHRIGGYEGLEQRMNYGNWEADFGDEFNPKSGATVCGVRNFLLAYNINLTTKDLDLAKKIAYSLRESAWPRNLAEHPDAGNALRLKAVKAIAWHIEDYDKVQVSVNLTDYLQSPLWKVFEECKKMAELYGSQVSGSELIGLIPLPALLECGRFYLPDHQNATENHLIQSAINGLGLDELEPFIPKDRILEYCLRN